MRGAMRLLAVVLGVVLVAVGLAWVSQRRLIYLPAQDVGPPPAALRGATQVTYDTEDGLRLGAWYVPAGEADTGWTMVVFPGNAGNRSDRAALAEALSDRGIGVLLVDYRGYGGNPGSPTEAGLAADARAALGYLETRSDVDPHRLAYFGESLGAAVAVELAGHTPPAALVLRSPFTSLADAAATHYPFLPMNWLLWDTYPSRDRILTVGVPTLVIAGSADGIVPLAQSQDLFAASTGTPKRLVVVEGADHNDFALVAGPEMTGPVAAFLAEVGSVP